MKFMTLNQYQESIGKTLVEATEEELSSIKDEITKTHTSKVWIKDAVDGNKVTRWSEDDKYLSLTILASGILTTEVAGMLTNKRIMHVAIDNCGNEKIIFVDSELFNDAEISEIMDENGSCRVEFLKSFVDSIIGGKIIFLCDEQNIEINKQRESIIVEQLMQAIVEAEQQEQ